MRNIAIIPARSGSKGIKDKNIKLINGKPLLAYSIEAAKKSECFDIVMVSTDSKKYAKIAKEYGAEVPFLRSKANSNDNSSSWSAVNEVLSKYNKKGLFFDTFMLLQPTSPLRTELDIKKAFKVFKEKKANSVVSVCEDNHVTSNLYNLKKNMYLSPFLVNRNNSMRRQDQKKYYRFNGAIYLAKVDYFMKHNDIYSEKCYAYLMDKETSIDIDSNIDFQLAELLINKIYGKK